MQQRQPVTEQITLQFPGESPHTKSIGCCPKFLGVHSPNTQFTEIIMEGLLLEVDREEPFSKPRNSISQGCHQRLSNLRSSQQGTGPSQTSKKVPIVYRHHPSQVSSGIQLPPSHYCEVYCLGLRATVLSRPG